MYCELLYFHGAVALCSTCNAAIGYMDKYGFIRLHNVRLQRFDLSGTELIGARRELFPVNGTASENRKRSMSAIGAESGLPLKKIRPENPMIMCVKISGDSSAITYNIDDDDDSDDSVPELVSVFGNVVAFDASTPNHSMSPIAEGQSSFLSSLGLVQNANDTMRMPLNYHCQLAQALDSPITLSDGSELYDSLNEVDTIIVVDSFHSSDHDQYSNWSEEEYTFDDGALTIYNPSIFEATTSFAMMEMNEHPNFRTPVYMPVFGTIYPKILPQLYRKYFTFLISKILQMVTVVTVQAPFHRVHPHQNNFIWR